MLKVVYVRKGDITYLWYFQHFLCSCIMYAIIEQILHAALQPKKKIVNVILFPEITDYPDNIRCSVEDQNLLALFEVDTGQHKKEKCGYRKRTGPYKLLLKQPLVETRISLLVCRIL